MEDFGLVRRMVLVDGLSEREVARQLGFARKSVHKAVQQASPPGYRTTTPRACPVLDAFKPVIDAWLDLDKQAPRKQRHTAARIHERLVAEHAFQGSVRSVSSYVARCRKVLTPSPVFAPMDYEPGFEIQIDWGQGSVILNGNSCVFFFFCARLPFSKATFVRAYAKDDLPSFLDAHNHLFEYLQGVPEQLAYDNLKSAVIKVYTGRRRELNRRLVELKSHYLFQTRFCNVASGNEKGHVENSVKRTERTYLTPIPQVTSLRDLNTLLRDHCVRDLQRVDQGTGKTYGELLQQESPRFRALPADPFPACVVEPARIDKQSTVVHDRCRYSVPVRHARQHSRLRIHADRVEVLVGDEIVVTHERGDPGQWRLDFEHYIPLLDRKPGWLESAKPFKKVRDNPTLCLLRRELEHRHGESGVRQFIAILQLIENYTWDALLAAIERCVQRRVFHEQAVLLELQMEVSQVLNPIAAFGDLDLSDRPQLLQCGPGLRSLSIYDDLLACKHAACAVSTETNPCVEGLDPLSSRMEMDDLEKDFDHAAESSPRIHDEARYAAAGRTTANLETPRDTA